MKQSRNAKLRRDAMFSGHKSDRKNESCEGWKSSWLQNHTAAELWKAPLKVTQALLRAGSAKPNCPGPCTFKFWTPPMVVTPPHLWTTCSGVWPLSQCNQNKGVSLPLQSEALPHALSLTTPERSLSASFTIEKIPKTFSSLHCAVPAPSASPHSTGTPNTWWLWWPLAGLPAEHPCLKLRSPEVDTALQRKSRPAGKALPRAAPEAFGSKRTLLAHGQHGVHQDPPKPFAQSCFPVAQPCSLRSSQLSSFYFKMQQ